MFTTGRIIFAIIFIIAFIIFMVISYKKDAKNHEVYYKNAAKKSGYLWHLGYFNICSSSSSNCLFVIKSVLFYS